MKQTGPCGRTMKGIPKFAKGTFQAKGCAKAESRVCENESMQSLSKVDAEEARGEWNEEL